MFCKCHIKILSFEMFFSIKIDTKGICLKQSSLGIDFYFKN